MSRALAALFALLLVAGCSSDNGDGSDTADAPETSEGTSQEPTQDAEPTEDAEESEPTDEAPEASGELVSGTGYTYSAPEGWGTPEQQAPGFNPDSLVADLGDTDQFTDNINVILSPAGAVTPEQVETAGLAELEAVGATDRKVNDRVEVAGSESAHLSATMSMNAIEYAVHQFYATNDDQTYVITFSFSPSVSLDERAEAYGAALASWTWTD